MAGHVQTSAGRAAAADVIPLETAGRSVERPPFGSAPSEVPLHANWLDAQVLDLDREMAASRLSALPGQAEQASTQDLENGINGPAKRLLDVAVSAASIVALAPVLVLIAACIAVDSKGPVFFRQFRHGRDRRPFKIYKFRTMMMADGDAPVLQAKNGDGRITRVGGFLRRTSLDELPQLFNVLLGQMSIVGPRPHAIRHDLVFERHLSDYRLRFRSKPGIIGLAQLNGARGEITCRRDIVLRTKLDLLYQRKWSLLLDLRLLLVTPFRLVRDLVEGRSY